MKFALIALVVFSLILLIGLLWQSKKMLSEVVKENKSRPKQPRPRQLHPKLQNKQ
ncbi:hypothetical protein [Acinetobacter nectaris]|uniref:hypothetical protein n=1 Tax=Acinetobacter nectaris TaxID=1219382 RepID=UPI001F31AE96|nr:hypothetical protein [Acinetobacter nectaris]MCF9035345.1 hypothetical protein [Acinetobacter nectaris]